MTLWDYVKAIFSIGMEKRNQTSDSKVLALYSALADGVKDNVSENLLYVLVLCVFFSLLR